MTISESNVIDILNQYEARGMRTQQDIVWHTAQGHTITDTQGKEYIDFSSGVMIANAGHNCQPIKEAITEFLNKGLLTSYMFPNLAKAKLFTALADCIPEHYKIALFSTGAETTEAAIKIARLWGARHKPHSKNSILSYTNAFHGRTLGALCVAGLSGLKQWLPDEMSRSLSYQVPFPEPFYSKKLDFSEFLKALETQKVTAHDIAAVIIECYQGVVGAMAPVQYMEQLSHFCRENNILLIIDEIQSGFGRTGKFWAYQHYPLTPDIILAGKGMSSSLPLSAVIAKPEVIDVCDPGTLNTTHSGNLICCAAAAANIEFIKNNKLADRAEKLGKVFAKALNQLKLEFPHQLREIFTIGLMAAIQVGDRTTHTANAALAKRLVSNCIKQGLMMYSPGGPEGATVKLAPPLVISEEALLKGCDIIKETLRGERAHGNPL